MKSQALLLTAALATMWLLLAAGPANAEEIDFTIDVEVNGIPQGRATTSGGILDVTVNVGDTVRIIVGIGAVPDLFAYDTMVTADDPTEIDYWPTASAQDNNLIGPSLNFAPLGDPNEQLTNSSPGSGRLLSVFNSGGVSATDLYFLDYVVGEGLNSDANVDFSLYGLIRTGTDGESPVSGTARVRLNSPFPEPPEPPDPLSDDDEDGEVNATDMCPDTFEGEEVDQAGCSQEQFCSNIDVSGSVGRRTCRSSDWKNDEPLRLHPRDCRVAGGSCLLDLP